MNGIGNPLPRPLLPLLPDEPAISDSICPNQLTKPEKSFEIKLLPSRRKLLSVVSILIIFPSDTKLAVFVN